MARTQTIVTAITCDMCGAEGEQSFVILIDSGVRQLSRPRVVDLCAEHADPIRTLQMDVRRHGVIVDVSASAPTITCPLCAHEASKSNMYHHLRDAHKLTAPVQPKKCPDCGIDSPTARHRVAAHGYDLLAAYVESASNKRKAR